MRLRVEKHPEEIRVTALLDATEPTLSFRLARPMKLVEVAQNGKPVTWTAAPCEEPMLTPLHLIALTGLSPGPVTARYSGPVEGYYGFNDHNILAMGVYNAWYPLGPGDGTLDPLEPAEITVLLPRPWVLVNGEYSEAEDCWHYRSQDFDLNILAIKDFERMENERMTVWYPCERYRPAASPYFEHYSTVVAFYQELFGTDRCTEHLTVVFLPEKEDIGAYKRAGLIVVSAPDDNLDETTHRLAHETAHIWATGANCGSWEDWLNETVAEWAALLYELSRGNRTGFHRSLEEKRQELGLPLPKLKTPDGARPGNTEVHVVGGLTLYNLFAEYGQQAIVDILRAFDGLEEKTTAGLLDVLRQSGKVVLADELSRYI